MKTLYTIVLFITAFSFTSFGQLDVHMPYYTGFDNATEKEGWAEYKKAATTFSHWGYNDADAFSDPTCISHDYSPSTGITLTDNWFVSPTMTFIGSNVLDSLRYKFTGFSVPEEGDTIAVYLLFGSQDPDLASSRLLLADFRGEDYVTDGVYRKLEPISLPASVEPCYLAIRYRNTDCSSKWLTVYFDNIAISGDPSGSTGEELSIQTSLTVFPNPTSGKIQVSFNRPMQKVMVADILGKVVYTDNTPNLTGDSYVLDIKNQPPGVYFVQVSSASATITKRIVLK